ncbi:MAG: esterase family protein [Campylobacterales bacterium]|nr:esterase family protein [Campylobacterales bacterium]
MSIARHYHLWYSSALRREMELLVFGHAGARVIVFPTKAGRFFDYENWGLVEALKSKIAAGYIQLFCVDSVDAESFYCDWCVPQDRAKRHLLYEHYILNEVLPFSLHYNPNPFVIAHGCSLGAFHALNIAFRHPQHFHKAVALSGRYDLGLGVGSYRDLFDGYRDTLIQENTPNAYIPSLKASERLSRIRELEIIIAIGRDDVLLQNNLELSQAMSRQNIRHHLYIWDEEAHRSRYWRQMVKHYL